MPPGRFCKTCRHLRRIDCGDGTLVYRCGWSITIDVPWAAGRSRQIAPDAVISPRHVVPGDQYERDPDGSTRDWTEVMDCPVWAPMTS